MGIGRSRTECAIVWSVSDEDILREGIVKNSPASTDYRPPLAGQVIGEADTGSEVVIVLVVELAGRNQAAGNRGIETVEEIVFLTCDSEVVPANAVVDGESRGPAKTVLNIEAMTIFEGVPARVALRLFSAARQALQKSLEIRYIGAVVGRILMLEKPSFPRKVLSWITWMVVRRNS